MAESREAGCQVRAVPWKRRGGPAGQGRGELYLEILENYWVLDSEWAVDVGSMELASTQSSAQLDSSQPVSAGGRGGGGDLHSGHS